MISVERGCGYRTTIHRVLPVSLCDRLSVPCQHDCFRSIHWRKADAQKETSRSASPFFATRETTNGCGPRTHHAPVGPLGPRHRAAASAVRVMCHRREKTCLHTGDRSYWPVVSCSLLVAFWHNSKDRTNASDYIVSTGHSGGYFR